MKLTGRDGVAVLAMAACTAVLLAVTQAWGWPLLGSYRTGTLAMWVIGQGMCTAGAGNVMTSKKQSRAYIATMSTLGGGALILVILGLIIAWPAVFVSLYGVILLMWIVTTVRHLIRPAVTQAAIPEAVHTEKKEPALTH